MPYVNIKITDEAVSRQAKEELVRRTTQMLVDVLNKNPETTVVVIDEVSTDNWGIGGQLVSDRRKQER
ncbi:MAG: 2-hydroxymuconate tautomerase family protein [Pseudomonadales bacterium]